MPTSPDPFKDSAALLKRVAREYETLRQCALELLQNSALGADKQQRVEELLAGSELTYLLRLFAAFEAGLEMMGPVLSKRILFRPSATLAEKLDSIGVAMKIDKAFRSTVDRDLRELRNELMHGRSMVPRL